MTLKLSTTVIAQILSGKTAVVAAAAAEGGKYCGDNWLNQWQLTQLLVLKYVFVPSLLLITYTACYYRCSMSTANYCGNSQKKKSKCYHQLLLHHNWMCFSHGDCLAVIIKGEKVKFTINSSLLKDKVGLSTWIEKVGLNFNSFSCEVKIKWKNMTLLICSWGRRFCKIRFDFLEENFLRGMITDNFWVVVKELKISKKTKFFCVISIKASWHRVHVRWLPLMWNRKNDRNKNSLLYCTKSKLGSTFKTFKSRTLAALVSLLLLWYNTTP